MADLRQHVNIVRYFGCVIDKTHCALVMECCAIANPNGSGSHLQTLRELLDEPAAEIDLFDCLEMVAGIASGIAFLHGERVGMFNRPVVHGDLKCANVFLAPAGVLASGDGARMRYVPKLGDFGLSRVRGVMSVSLTSTLSAGGGVAGGGGGTLAWMAPEIMEGERNCEPSDVYSFAMVMFEILSRRCPFSELNDPGRLIPTLVRQGRRPSLPADVESEIAHDKEESPKVFIYGLMKMCWEQHPADRPPMSRVANVLRARVNAAQDAAIDDGSNIGTAAEQPPLAWRRA